MFRLTWSLRGVIGVNTSSFSRYFSTSSPVFDSSKNDKFRPKGRRANVPNDDELLLRLRQLGIGGTINEAPSFEELTTFEVDDTIPKPSYDPDLEDVPTEEEEEAVAGAGGIGGSSASALTGGLTEQKEEESPLEKILQQTIDRNAPSRQSDATTVTATTSAASKDGINLENMPKTIEEAENRAVDVMFELHHKRNSSSKLEARKFRQMMLKADRIEQSIIEDEYPPLEETPPTEKEYLEQYSKITDDDYRLYPPTFESEMQNDSDEVKVGERSDKERELLEQLPADFRNDPELNTMESLVETSIGDSIRRLIRKVGDSHTRYRKTTLFQQDYNENKFIKERLDMSKFTFKEMLKIGSHTKVTKGGRVNTVSVLIIVGDQNGTAGLGYGKGLEMMEAVDAATRDAFKHLVSIDRWEERTICGFLNAKVRTTKVYMWPLTKGEGTKSSPLAAAVFEAFGVDDVSCKIYPSNSVHNTVHALIKALTMSVHPETIAKSLGQKVFDINNIRRSNGRTRAF